MKASRAALGLVVVLLAGLWFAGGGTSAVPPSAAAAEQTRVSEPVSHDNLTVYFIHGKDAVADARVATLQEAIAAGWAVVHETGSVNELAVENRSPDTELFIQEGDIIKGGKQDRLIAIDMLLPPNSGRVSFPAHCVEQGRWTGRGHEPAAKFHASTKFAVGNDLKFANATYQQGEVWKNVAVAQDKLSENVGKRINAEESASSLQLSLENPAVIAMVSAYEDALRSECAKRKNVVGVVFAINGKMTGAEVYGSSALFEKAWPKLLNSAATEALAEKNARSHAAAPNAREVERFLACGGEPQAPPMGQEGGVRLIGDGVANDVTAANGEGRGRILRHFGTVGTLINVERTETGTGQFMIGGGFNTDSSALRGRSGATRAALIQQDGGQPNRRPNVIAQDELFQTEGRQELIQTEGRAVQTEARPSTPGNRLNINRVGNAAGLVTESRDAGRGNAVIHKSYIKR
jgi:ARG/rhodanese/phosphatase superfamily protein